MYQLDTPAKEDSSSGRESGDAVGADHEGRGSGDEEERTDWGVRRVDGDGDSDRRKGTKARKRVKGRKRFLTAMSGVMTRARGRGISGNVPTPVPKTFPRSQ